LDKWFVSIGKGINKQLNYDMPT
ncbi:unnamed protein product, partial [Vitis vinifera]